MFEKVNPSHPDKVADRIAGALVDYAYKCDDNPRIAVEVLIGHNECHIIAETSVTIPLEFVEATVERIAGLKDIKVDTGATNRKLGSDIGRAVTGGGLHGKDLSKADVAINIYAHLKAQETGRTVEFSCAIGDSEIDGKPYEKIVEEARKYINNLGGFEKLAEWGII